MRGERIYIGTSIFDSIFAEKESTSDAAIELLELCRSQEDYISFISPFTIFEIKNRQNNNLDNLYELLRRFNVKVIGFTKPKEVEFLTSLYKEKKVLPNELEYDYYHLATANYLDLNYFCSWNTKNLITYEAERKLLVAHRFNGYRPSTKLVSPEYFSNIDRKESTYDLFQTHFESKSSSLNQLEQRPFGERSIYAEQLAKEYVNEGIELVKLPDVKKSASRLDTITLHDEKMKFEIIDFKKDIEDKTIPLLDLDYESIGMDVHFEMIKLEVVDGQEELKNRQLKLIYHLPTQNTQQQIEQINKERNKDFLDWLLPQIRKGLHDNIKEYDEISIDWIRRYHYREIDQNLANSIHGESLELIKTKAIQLNKFITNKAWQYYRGFSFPGQWCKFNDGYDHGEFTHIITEKDGKEIWLIFVNEIVP